MRRLAKLVLSASLVLPIFAGAANAQASSLNEDIVSYSKNLIGIPYVYGGATTSGFDCSGFLRYVYSQYNVELPRISSDQFSAGTPVEKGDLKPGDAVFFETYKSGPSHSGIYIGDSQFIHADATKGISISSIEDPYYWKSRYLGAKRYVQEAPKAASLHADGNFRGLAVKSGQIGIVEVKKPINLWKRNSSNKLEMVRILKPGEKYRVYVYDTMYGGQYGLGSSMYITNMPEHIDYYEL